MDRLDIAGYFTSSFAKAKDRWKQSKRWIQLTLRDVFLTWWNAQGLKQSYDAIVPIPWSVPEGSKFEDAPQGPRDLVTAAYARCQYLFPDVTFIPNALVRRDSAQLKDSSTVQDRIDRANKGYLGGPQIGLVKGKRVLLVDDVSTVGASMTKCAKLLRDAGAAYVGGFVIAKRLPPGVEVEHKDPEDCPHFKKAAWVKD